MQNQSGAGAWAAELRGALRLGANADRVRTEQLLALATQVYGDDPQAQEDVRSALQSLDPENRGIDLNLFCEAVLHGCHQNEEDSEESILKNSDEEEAVIRNYAPGIFTFERDAACQQRNAKLNHQAAECKAMLGTTAPSFVVTTEPPVTPTQEHTSLTDMDSALGSPSLDPKNTNSSSSQCSSMSDGESYECLGEGSPAPSPVVKGDSSPANILKRNTWSRSSLRRTPTNARIKYLPNNRQNSGGDSAIGRRWGSLRQPSVVEEKSEKCEPLEENSSGKRISANGAVPSALCRSASFNSSGRSSNCGDPDDMYCSDASLEEDVMGLNRKVHMLQQQVTALADTQNTTDDRYGRARHENALLQARLMILEEQVREEQSRAEQRLQEEQRRQKDLITRLEREKQLELENSAIRLQAAERRSQGFEEEVKRVRGQVERQAEGRRIAEEAATEAEAAGVALRAQLAEVTDAARKRQEALEQELADTSQCLEEARLEAAGAADIRRRPSSPGARNSALEEETRALREEVRTLRESLEEAQAQLLGRGLEQGRNLLVAADAPGGPSLADELDEMSSDKVRLALREQQEVNVQLRSYIDGILLNIVENYPQLLEVKTVQGRLK